MSKQKQSLIGPSEAPGDPDKKSNVVRLGSGYTTIQMSKAERIEAIDSAHWRFASPHEWVWDVEDQARMAKYVLWAAQRLEMISNLSAGLVVEREKDDDK